MPPSPWTDRTLGFLVSDIARLLRRNMDRRLQSLGLTQAQWRAIVHLSRSEGMTQAMLAESLEIQPITLTRLIDRMESAGWVERRTHPLDRRAVQLYLDAAVAADPRGDARARHGYVERCDARCRRARAAPTRRRRSSRSSTTSSPRKARRFHPSNQERLVMADQETSPSAPRLVQHPRALRPLRRASRAVGCARPCCCWGRSSR